MRICTQRSTGKLIEMQSLATPGTLTENAKQAGYDENDIDEHEGTGGGTAALAGREFYPTAPADVE